MTIQAVLWDWGGVLMRTEDRGPRTRLADSLGMTYEQLDEAVFGSPVARSAVLGRVPMAAFWAETRLSLQVPPETWADFEQAFFGGDVLDLELVEFVRSLRPRFKTGLLSNYWSDLREKVLQTYHLVDVFDELVVSSEVGLSKPGREIYQIAVERLGVAPCEAVFVDDFIENVDGARAAGLHSLQFKSRQQILAALQPWLAA